MAHLSISLLGAFKVALDDRSITDSGMDQAWALLAYLAVEAKRSHRRDALAGLLWAECSHTRARHSLRQGFDSQIRVVPLQRIERETVQLSTPATYSRRSTGLRY
jgi:DNA-binding SARP family transcriptional activator